MDKSSQDFVWKELVVFSTYVPKGLPFLICIKKLVRLRSSVLSLFVTNQPHGGPSGMPCGACREFLMELHPDNRNLEFMVDYETRQTITLGELLPLWWGEERAQQFEEKLEDKS